MSKKNSEIFALGGIAYGLIEIVWRGKTHWSMVLAGGAVFLSLFRAFEKLRHKSTWKKCIIGSGIITAWEFVSGCILNKLLKLNVWDYSRNRLNIKGQICPLYSFLWGLLCIPVNLICKKIGQNG